MYMYILCHLLKFYWEAILAYMWDMSNRYLVDNKENTDNIGVCTYLDNAY